MRQTRRITQQRRLGSAACVMNTKHDTDLARETSSTQGRGARHGPKKRVELLTRARGAKRARVSAYCTMILPVMPAPWWGSQ
jgi:hypothetical protein